MVFFEVVAADGIEEWLATGFDFKETESITVKQQPRVLHVWDRRFVRAGYSHTIPYIQLVSVHYGLELLLEDPNRELFKSQVEDMYKDEEKGECVDYKVYKIESPVLTPHPTQTATPTKIKVSQEDYKTLVEEKQWSGFAMGYLVSVARCMAFMESQTISKYWKDFLSREIQVYNQIVEKRGV